MTALAVIQARMGSQRYPGKSLASFRGVPLAEWVVRRAMRLRTVSGVVLATSLLHRDDALAAALTGICPVYRGSESDVAARIRGACDEHRCRREDDIVVRVCADSPLWRAEGVDAAVEALLAARQRVDYEYVSGTVGCDTVGVDVMIRRVLDRSVGEDAAQWIVGARALLVAGRDRMAMRMSIDTPEDLARLEALECE